MRSGSSGAVEEFHGAESEDNARLLQAECWVGLVWKGHSGGGHTVELTQHCSPGALGKS